MRPRALLLSFSAALLFFAAVAAAADRPASWATPLPGRAGLPNLHQVSETLYRGAQPDEQGFATLKSMGVKTVVNLRSFHSDRSECRRAGLDYVHVDMQAWEGEDEELTKVLKVLADPARQPVFVHCQHGADRTGVTIAAYRMAVQGWSNEAAVDELTNGGYGFHAVWRNLVSYVRQLDVERLRQLAGLPGEEKR